MGRRALKRYVLEIDVRASLDAETVASVVAGIIAQAKDHVRATGSLHDAYTASFEGPGGLGVIARATAFYGDPARTDADFMTASAAAKEVGHSRAWVDRLGREGKVIVREHVGLTLVSLSSLRAYLATARRAGRPKVKK